MRVFSVTVFILYAYGKSIAKFAHSPDIIIDDSVENGFIHRGKIARKRSVRVFGCHSGSPFSTEIAILEVINMVNNVTQIAGKLLASTNAKRTSLQAFQIPQDVGISNAGLKNEPLLSVGFRVPNGGWMTVNVFKAENFCEENPVMLVKGTNVCGTPFEKEVNIRGIDPQNASFVELLAFDGYSTANGRPSQTARIAARALLMQELNGKEFSEFNAFTQMDSVGALKDLLESLRKNQNYETLLWANENLEYFFKHFDIER